VRNASIVASSPGILPTLGVSLRHGRSWNATDVRPIVLNRSIALELFGTEAAVGRTVELQWWRGDRDQPFVTHFVVGVAADTDTGHAGRRDPTRGTVYVPIPPRLNVPLVFAAQARLDGDAAARAIRETIAAVDPEVAIRMSGAAARFAGYNYQFFEIAGGVTRLLGSLAWVLALVGLYGVVSHVVLARTREIGVRMALGASQGAIVRMILFEGLLPVGFGIVGGLALGGIARQLLHPGFQRMIPPFDVAVLALAPALFLFVAFIACYLPARRAARIDPNVALRVS
jgi:putative ABC transport system permease protein